MRSMAFLFAPLLIATSAGCSEPSPVVEACKSLSDRIGQPDTANQCNCVDNLVRRHLEPDQYAVFEAMVIQADNRGSDGAWPDFQQMSLLVADHWANAERNEQAIMIGDIALITAKAVTRCAE